MSSRRAELRVKLRLSWCFALVLLAVTNCTFVGQKGSNKLIGGTSDPIEGKYATVILGRSVGVGLDYALPDGRSYSLTLVKGTMKDGTEDYFVTADKNGALNAKSVLVPKPNSPFHFALPSEGSSRPVAVWSTEGISVPFEAPDNSLQGTGTYVERLVKVPGVNGRGSALLFHTSGEVDRTLVNVYLNGTQEIQTIPGPATESVVGGQLRYNRVTTSGGNQRIDFMEINSPTSGKVGFNAAGQETTESGQLFGMAPRITEPARHQRIADPSTVAKWTRVPNGRGVYPPAHKIWFAEIIKVNGVITRPATGAFFEYVLPTTATSPNENEVALSGLEDNKFYRFAVASCETADCSLNLKWAMVDFFGPSKKTEPPVFVSPVGTTSALAPVAFTYRSANQPSHDATTHFEVWAAIYRNGAVVKRLTDVSQRLQDLWAPVQVNQLPSAFGDKIYSYSATPENVGDTLNVQVRSCADNREYTALPRACSAWAVKTVTITGP